MFSQFLFKLTFVLTSFDVKTCFQQNNLNSILLFTDPQASIQMAETSIPSRGSFWFGRNRAVAHPLPATVDQPPSESTLNNLTPEDPRANFSIIRPWTWNYE